MPEATLADIHAELINLGQLLTAIYIQQSRMLDFMATDFLMERNPEKYKAIKEHHAAGGLLYPAPALQEEDEDEEAEQKESTDAEVG